MRSRSSSLMALLRARWFFRSISSGVILRPNNHSIVMGGFRLLLTNRGRGAKDFRGMEGLDGDGGDRDEE